MTITIIACMYKLALDMAHGLERKATRVDNCGSPCYQRVKLQLRNEGSGTFSVSRRRSLHQRVWDSSGLSLQAGEIPVRFRALCRKATRVDSSDTSFTNNEAIVIVFTLVVVIVVIVIIIMIIMIIVIVR